MAASKTLLAGTGVLALLALSACGNNTQATPTQTETVTVTAEAPAPSSSASSATAAESSASASASASPSSATSAPYTNDDVKAAIDAALAQYANGTLVSVDSADHGQSFEIDLVDGETVHELRVDRSGNVTVEESSTEPNSDDVTEAREAQVSGREAIDKALEGRADLVVDKAELDRDNGVLMWEVELDDAAGRDAAKVWVNAVDGSVTSR